MRALLKRIVLAMPSSIRTPIHRLAILYEHSGIRAAQLDPDATRLLATQFRVITDEYGGARSAAAKRCVDAHGNPIPWISYPAIEFLGGVDFSRARVFEYGSGQSTLWWAARAAHVAAVEHDPKWAEYVQGRLPSNSRLFIESDEERYASAVHLEGDGYDVIVVDGKAERGMRYRCAREAIPRLNPGGCIVLDNADYLPRTCALLRDAGLVEIPFAGLVPLNTTTSATTVFLSRDFAWQLRKTETPFWVLGGFKNDWEADQFPAELLRPRERGVTSGEAR